MGFGWLIVDIGKFVARRWRIGNAGGIWKSAVERGFEFGFVLMEN
jgi:hypothetical protein